MNQDTPNCYFRKNREKILDGTKTVLGSFGFDRSVFGIPMRTGKR
jgi:hypothetical protein